MEQQKKLYVSIDTKDKITILSSWLTEKKAEDLLALDLAAHSSVAEALVIVTATSIRHAQGLADTVLERCRQEKIEFLSMEGYAVGQWILLDLNDVLIHIFQKENRELYKLDDLWPDAKTIVDQREETR